MEEKFSQVEQESKVRLQEAEEARFKATQLQETIERLESNLSNLESENQVLRQQALVASMNEEVSEELTVLRSKISDLESENELLLNRTVIVEQKTTSESVQPPVQSLENGKPTEEEIQRTESLENGKPTEEEIQRTKVFSNFLDSSLFKNRLLMNRYLSSP